MGQIEPWKGMSPSEGDDAPYTLEVFLQVSADCFEAALQSMLGTAKRANWAKSIFNMLLKHAGDAKKTGKKGKKKEEAGGSKEGGGGKEGISRRMLEARSMAMLSLPTFRLLLIGQVLLSNSYLLKAI